MENLHQTLICLKISITSGFVEKFLQKVALLEHFHKTLFSWEISKKNLVGKISAITFFIENFHQN